MFINDLKTILFILLWIYISKRNIKIVNINMKEKIIEKATSIQSNFLSKKSGLIFARLNLI